MFTNPANPAAPQAVELTEDDLDAVSGGWRRGGFRRTARNTGGAFKLIGLALTSPWAAKRQKQNQSYKKALNQMVSD